MEDSHRTRHSGPVSVVIAAHDQAPELRRNLPLLLTQQYEPGFEVIVVDESSADDTADVLKQLSGQYPNLYTTYIPASSHYVSRRKLALTIGIKAAKSEWVVLTGADCHPESPQWLNALAGHMTPDADIVCAYTDFDPSAKGRYAYLRMLTWKRLLRRPYRHDGANLAVRKASFMEHNGFLKNLQFLRGEYDFLVNESPGGRIAVTNDPESRMRQEAPSAAQWEAEQLSYMNIRAALRNAFLSRLLFLLWQSMLHVSLLLAVAVLAVAIVRHHIVATVAAAAFLLLFLAARTAYGYRLCKACGGQLPLWKLAWLDLGIAWHYAYYWLRYRLADKNDFARK